MVGIIGTLGDVCETGPSRHLRWSAGERTRSYDDGRVAVHGTFHAGVNDDQPKSSPDEDALVWIFGEVYGHGDPQDAGYSPRPAGVDSASYCAELYAEHDAEFVSELNGDFVGVVYDRTAETVFLFTDRLGSVPLFYSRLDGGRMVFSTSVQAVAAHPDVETSFELEYLHEYLVFKRSFGVKTPLTGIERHPPGSVTAVDLETETWRTTTYWRPRYEPEDRPFEYFVDEFVRRFRQIFDEWIADDRSYGVLLSGGSDSRLCLAGVAERGDVTAFHMAGWMSREARTAERSALVSDAEFRWLRRDADYQRTALDRNAPIANFNGWFSQGYATGFDTEIGTEVDALVSGMYADSLFKGHTLPSPHVNLGRLGKFELPLETSVESIDEYVDWLVEGASDELDLPTDLRSVLSDNIVRDGDGIDHHGIHYDSLQDLIQCGKWYPLTNDDDMIFRNSLRHLRPYRTPYLDRRLVELSLRMPRRYQLRRNVINRALARIDAELANVPHAHSGVPPARPFPIEFLGKVAHAFWRKHVTAEEPPQPHLSNGPWVDDSELLRTHDFGKQRLEANEPVVRALPFLEWDNVMDCYRRHADGENRIVELYGLLTLLEMPIVRELAIGEEPPTSAALEPDGDRVVPRSAVRGGSND